jgi:long-chain fatty acid transport protein
MYGAGFGIFEHGAKAMGMAGAFTAQADDGSAMFHNVAGLAFQKERSFMAGATFISVSESTFQGMNPYPGEDATGEQKRAIFYPAHAYWVQPLGETWTLGLGFNNPFGLTTEWDDVDNWSGRFISYRAELRTFDLSANLGWQASPTFGVGIGIIARFSDLELRRRVGAVDPFSFVVRDVADARLAGDMETGFGWTLGVLHKYNNSFSWGLSYRSKVEVDYGGEAYFTQISTGNPALDGLVTTLLPFDTSPPIETSITMPATASFGVMLALSQFWIVEIDVNWTEWSVFDELSVVFPENPELSFTEVQGYEDVFNYRIGFQWTTGVNQWRFGYVYDETPQPEFSVSPLLPDNDRNGFTIGWGHNGARFTTDLALMYLPFGERTTTTNSDNFNGTYDTTSWLLGASLSF